MIGYASGTGQTKMIGSGRVQISGPVGNSGQHHTIPLTGHDHLRHLRVSGEFGHSPAQFGQFPLVIESPQGVQLLEGKDQRLMGRGVQEIEVNQIIDSQGFQHEHHVAQVGPLDLEGGGIG